MVNYTVEVCLVGYSFRRRKIVKLIEVQDIGKVFAKK